MNRIALIFAGIVLVLSASYGVYAYSHNREPKKYINEVTTTIRLTPIATIITTPSATPTPTVTENTCNDLNVLVDRTYGLSSTYTPPDLINLSSYAIPVTSTSLQARKIVVPDLERLFTDSKAAGINLIVVSPYRSYAVQESVYNGYVAQYGKSGADQFSAIPGHSQHQLGTAIDFSTSSLSDQLDQSFANTPAGEWLLANAYKYGFYISYPEGKESITGYEYEPWHFRYLGIQTALSLKNSGLDMETFLMKYGVKPNC